MKTGAEIIDFKSFNAQNKQSIGDFEKLRSHQINDVVDTNHEIYDDDISDSEDINEIQPDELIINGGTSIKHFHSYPYGIGKEPNINNDNGVSRIKKFTDFNY